MNEGNDSSLSGCYIESGSLNAQTDTDSSMIGYFNDDIYKFWFERPPETPEAMPHVIPLCSNHINPISPRIQPTP